MKKSPGQKPHYRFELSISDGKLRTRIEIPLAWASVAMSALLGAGAYAIALVKHQ